MARPKHEDKSQHKKKPVEKLEIKKKQQSSTAASQKSAPQEKGNARHKHIEKKDRGITTAAFRRLARKGGAKRISKDIYGTLKFSLEKFVSQVLQDAVTYSEYAKTKTVTACNVVSALKHRDMNLYGFSQYE